jgi:epoxyqueuosine reductase
MIASILEQAKLLGASLAGVVDLASLQDAPSCRVYSTAEFPARFRSVLVLALVHPETHPELDWWGVEGGTIGNQRLQQIFESLKQWLYNEYAIVARPIPYQLESGGIFLKDAAVLAGLGIIGKNNLLITPEFGPRVRLRALFLDKEVTPTKIGAFAPCDACEMPCRLNCPRNAFASGSYDRDACATQMRADEDHRVMIKEAVNRETPEVRIKYCRACELVCPIGQ